jgi:hypothetical protein
MQHWCLHLKYILYLLVFRSLIEACAADNYATLVWWKLPKLEEQVIQFVTHSESLLRDTESFHQELLMHIRWFSVKMFAVIKHLCILIWWWVLVYLSVCYLLLLRLTFMQFVLQRFILMASIACCTLVTHLFSSLTGFCLSGDIKFHILFDHFLKAVVKRCLYCINIYVWIVSHSIDYQYT